MAREVHVHAYSCSVYECGLLPLILSSNVSKIMAANVGREVR